MFELEFYTKELFDVLFVKVKIRVLNRSPKFSIELLQVTTYAGTYAEVTTKLYDLFA